MKRNYFFGLLLALFALGVPAVAQNTHCGEKDYDCQISQETRLIQADPKNADAWDRRGLANYRKQNYDSAIADLTKAIELDPAKTSAYTRRGFSYNSKKQYALAVADFNKSITLDPNYEEAYFGRARARWLQNDLWGAIADFDKYIELNPKKEGFLADGYCDRGSVRLQQGNDLGAIADFTNAIDVGHPYAHVYRYRGIARAGRDILEGAVADFTEAIKLEPQDTSNYKQRAAAYRRLGRTALASADEAKAAELEPSSAVVTKPATVSTPAASLAGTEWEQEVGEYLLVYQFEPNGKLFVYEDLDIEDGVWGTWRQENDDVFMDWSLVYSVRAKRSGGDWMTGTRTVNGKSYPWAASRRKSATGAPATVAGDPNAVSLVDEKCSIITGVGVSDDLRAGRVVTGELTRADGTFPAGYYCDSYLFLAQGRFRITMRSNDFDAYLQVRGLGRVLASAAACCGSRTDARVEFDSGDVPIWRIYARSSQGGETGRYTIQVETLERR